MGLPVLTTSFGEMALRRGEQGIFFLDGHGDLEAIIQASLSYQPDPDESTRWRAEHSWSARFDGVDLFHNLLSSAPGGQVA